MKTAAILTLAACLIGRGLANIAEPGPAPAAFIVDPGEKLRIELLATEFIGDVK